jgi:hypothetical protein
MALMKKFIKEARKLYEERRLRDLDKLFENTFIEYFRTEGYNLHPSAPLLSEEDKSVGFTGSSTNVVKPYILSGNFGERSGYIVAQECLRNHALKFAYDNSWLPFGQAYFHMITILSRPRRFEKVVKEMTELTRDLFGIDHADILLKSSRKFKELSRLGVLTPLRTEYDTLDESKYQWVYGMEGIRGEGITISTGHDPLDVGNLVRFLDEEKEEKAIEFGYGYEFFLSRMLGVENPLALSQVFEVFDFEPDISSKYYGYIEAISRIKKEKDLKNNVRSTVRGTYNKYLNALEHLRVPLKKSRENLFSDISKFCEFISFPANLNQEREYLVRQKRYI